MPLPRRQSLPPPILTVTTLDGRREEKRTMKIGKLPASLLERLLAQIDIKDPRVLLGPRVGEDAAIIDYGDRVLVAKSDPVTFATEHIGWYAVQVNANDVACTGAIPRWFVATVLLPTSFTEEEIETLFAQLRKACADLKVTLIGGHTEVTRDLAHPIVVGCMLGETEKGKTVTTGGAQDGDSILVTKGIALEGTALLARDAAPTLKEAGVREETIARAQELLFSPGISVVKEALLAVSSCQVHSMHDPTEGGLATGLWEVAQAAGVGLAVEEGSIPILPECVEVCQALGLNPLGLLASGTLLITLPPEDVPGLVSALEKEGIDAYEIGRITALEDGVNIISAHELQSLPNFERDELARFFEHRSNQ